MTTELANPTNPMLMAVTAGVRMTKYLIPVFSAKSPKKGLNNAGIRRMISRKALIDSDISSLAISRGNSGARNEEKVSCARWAMDSVSTSDFLNLVFWFNDLFQSVVTVVIVSS